MNHVAIISVNMLQISYKSIWQNVFILQFFKKMKSPEGEVLREKRNGNSLSIYKEKVKA